MPISNEQIQQFLGHAKEITPSLKELLAEFHTHEELVQQLPPDFRWAPLYELENLHLTFLVLASIGMIDSLVEAHQAGQDVNQVLLEMDHEAIIENWDRGHDRMFSEFDVIVIFLANAFSLRCVELHGCYMSDLIKRAREGDDESLFHAIEIDRSVISISFFADRISRAVLLDQKEFFTSLQKALKGKPHATLEAHKEIRMVLQMLHEAERLRMMSMSDIDKLFIKELQIYSNEGEEPDRSLMRFIQRWKAKNHTAT
jgi:hypothetical protein